MSRRIRSVKPEWLEDELLSRCSSDARVLSIALILMADDYGNGRCAILNQSAEVFPPSEESPEALMRSCERFREALKELVKLRFVGEYSVRNQHYFTIRKWMEHQKVQHPGKPLVPAPPENFWRVSGNSHETLTPDLRPTTNDQREEGNAHAREPAATLQSRAAECLREPYTGQFEQPQLWPEVQLVAKAFADWRGQRHAKRGIIPKDNGVMAILALFAAGNSPEDLEKAIKIAKEDDYCQAKVNGLSNLTIEVVNRLLSSSDKPTVKRPELKTLAEVEQEHAIARSRADADARSRSRMTRPTQDVPKTRPGATSAVSVNMLRTIPAAKPEPRKPMTAEEIDKAIGVPNATT